MLCVCGKMREKFTQNLKPQEFWYFVLVLRLFIIILCSTGTHNSGRLSISALYFVGHGSAVPFAWIRVVFNCLEVINVRN